VDILVVGELTMMIVCFCYVDVKAVDVIVLVCWLVLVDVYPFYHMMFHSLTTKNGW